MNEIFLIFLSLSISGSLIALLLFLLKPIIKDCLSKTWQYYVFLIVVVRLLFPFGPDTSLMGMVFNQVSDYIAVENNSAAVPNTDNILILPGDNPKEQTDGKTAIPSPAKNIKKTLTENLWLVWLVPAAFLLLRKVSNYHRYIRSIKNGCVFIANTHLHNICRESCEAMGIRHFPSLAINEQVPSPMLVGIMQPMIILPDTELKDADVRYIFRHELTHYKRLDIVYKWFMQIALCIHWFNPVIYWISREINCNCELSCDEAVIKRLNKKEKYAYGDMLLGAIRVDKIAPRATVSIKLNEDTKLIRERLKAIMIHKKQSHIVMVLSVLLTVILLCGAACTGAYTSSNSNSPGVQNENVPDVQPATIRADEIPITIDEVEMRYYEDDDPDGRWPYLHWIISNHSKKTITDYEMVCLAYDKDGRPLELIWQELALTNGYTVTGFTSQSDKSYEQIITLSEQPILPGAKEDLNGGWSLWDGWDQTNGTHDVAYVLACMKQVTFEDGTTWDNSDYTTWLEMHKGKFVDLELLQSYYSKK